MKYSSEIDVFYTVFIILVGFLGIIVSDVCFILGFWWLSLIILALFGFIYYLFFTSSVEVLDEKLQIKLGFFKKHIKYADIKEVKRAKNSISSFATSRNRIAIRTGNKTGIFNYVYISPKNSEKFIEELKLKIARDGIIKL